MLSQNKLTPPESKAAQKPNQRQSGIELLRIVSMFLVLLLHSLYYSLGRPTAEDYVNSGVEMVLRTEFEAISLVCVNVFVMISGWFGIKIKIKRLAEFIYQWLFLAVFVVAVLLISGIRFPIGDYKYLIGSYQHLCIFVSLYSFSCPKFFYQQLSSKGVQTGAIALLDFHDIVWLDSTTLLYRVWFISDTFHRTISHSQIFTCLSSPLVNTWSKV